MSEHVLPPLLTEERVRELRLAHKLTGDPMVVALCDAWLASRKPREGDAVSVSRDELRRWESWFQIQSVAHTGELSAKAKAIWTSMQRALSPAEKKHSKRCRHCGEPEVTPAAGPNKGVRDIYHYPGCRVLYGRAKP